MKKHEEDCQHDQLFVEGVASVAGRLVVIVKCNQCDTEWGAVTREVVEGD